MSLTDRLTAVDLRDLPEAEMAALRQEAITLRMPFSAYISSLVAKTSKELVQNATAPSTGGFTLNSSPSPKKA